MNLEGSLGTFQLPDILTLLATTGKTGVLQLRTLDRPAGMIRLVRGEVADASCDARSGTLARRVAGAGLLPDPALQRLVAAARDRSGVPLPVLLREDAGVAPEDLDRVAAEAATDAVCELLRWEAGSFGFELDEPDPAAGAVRLDVASLIAEGRRRDQALHALAVQRVSRHTVLGVTLAGSGEVVLSRDEWRLVALLDGHRGVGDLAMLLGAGEFHTASLVAGLLARGLLAPATDGGDVGLLLERARVLTSLDTVDEVPAHSTPATLPAVPPAALKEAPPVPELALNAVPVLAPVPPILVAQPPVLVATPIPQARRSELSTAGAGTGTGTGTGEIDRSLLLRLIAGVQGL